MTASNLDFAFSFRRRFATCDGTVNGGGKVDHMGGSAGQPQLPAFKRPIGRPQVTKGRRESTPAALKRTKGCPQRKLSPSAVAVATDQRGGGLFIGIP